MVGKVKRKIMNNLGSRLLRAVWSNPHNQAGGLVHKVVYNSVDVPLRWPPPEQEVEDDW